MNIKGIFETENEIKEIFIITSDVINECLYEALEESELEECSLFK